MDKASKDESTEDQWELDRELRKALGMSPLEADQELTDDDTFRSLMVAAAAAKPADQSDESELLLEDVISIPEDRAREEAPAPRRFERPADPGAITALEAELSAATDREQVAAVAVRIAACYARSSAVFVVNDETIAGLCAEGEGLAERIEGVLLSTATECMFSAPLRDARPYRRARSQAPDDARLMRALGRSEACDVLIVPVRACERIVNLLYADNGPDRLADTAVGALVTLGTCLTKVYERLVSAPRG